MVALKERANRILARPPGISDRDWDVFISYKATGVTVDDIESLYDVSRERVRQIVIRICNLHDNNGLSVRAMNVFKNLGVDPRDYSSLREMLVRERCHKKGLWKYLSDTKNCGRKTTEEIVVYIGERI